MKKTEITEIELTLNGHNYYDAKFIYEHINEFYINMGFDREKVKSNEPYCLLPYMAHILRHMCGVENTIDGTPYGQSVIKINSLQLDDYKKASQWLKSLKKVKMEFNLSEL
jgi:hypothetical protein